MINLSSPHCIDWCNLEPGVEHARVPECLKVKLADFFVANEYVVVLQDALTVQQGKLYMIRSH